jgi:hypothetical protein
MVTPCKYIWYKFIKYKQNKRCIHVEIKVPNNHSLAKVVPWENKGVNAQQAFIEIGLKTCIMCKLGEPKH